MREAGSRHRAMSVANCARWLHEQGKYRKAALTWKLARKRYAVAEPMLENERAIIIGWINKALAACAERTALGPNPEFRVLSSALANKPLVGPHGPSSRDYRKPVLLGQNPYANFDTLGWANEMASFPGVAQCVREPSRSSRKFRRSKPSTTTKHSSGPLARRIRLAS